MTNTISLQRFAPQRRWPALTLLLCGMTAGCQSPGFSTALSGKKAPAQPVSSTDGAGLPEPTNTASSNSPLSLSSADEHLRLGEEELNKGNYQQARMHFDHVLKEHPDHVKAHHRLGVLADKLNQFEQAEQHYLSALNGDPRNAALLSDLGYSYFMQGRHADAERYLLEARKLDPSYETAIANLGLLYGSIGRKQEALAMFRQIGDDQQVQAIMQQIESGEFGTTGRVASNLATQQSSVVTTQTTVQQASPVPADQMNNATRDFVEQLRKAREELQRAEHEFARHQQAQGAQLAQTAGGPQAMPQPANASQPTWAQQSPARQSTSWQNQQMTSQGQPAPNNPLSNAMANIDQQGARPPQNRPMTIGQQNSDTSLQAVAVQPASAAPQTIASQNTSASLPTVTPAGSDGFRSADNMVWNNQRASDIPQVHNNQPVPVYNGPSRNQPNMAGGSSTQQPAGTAPHGMQQSPTAPAAWRQQNPQPAGVAPQGNVPSAGGTVSASTPRSAWGQQFADSVSQQLPVIAGQPSGAIQQATGNMHASAEQPVQHAHHNQPPQNGQNIALAGQQGAIDPSLVPPSLNSQSAGSATNSYDAARRQAALMGLNSGPGQVFPYIQQTQRAMPGSDSRINGAQYPSPVRHMPSGLTPPAMNPPAAQHPQHQYHQSPPPAQADPYQQTRSQQAQQFNGLVNQTWGQSPQTPPYGVTPPATTQHYSSATTPPAQSTGVTPAPYYQRPTDPRAAQATPAGYQTMPQYNPSSAPQAAGGAVVPEAYSRRNQVPAGTMSPQSPPYTGPMIVPGEQP